MRHAPAMTTTAAPTTSEVRDMTHATGKLTARSGNHKIGPIPVTSRGQATCPTTCPLMGNGCFGENRGANPRTLFALADDAATVHTAETLAAGMRGGTPRTFKGRALRRVLPIVRDREVGDLVAPDGSVDHAWLSIVTDAARSVGRTVFGYTHAAIVTGADVPDGYVLNASCETPAGVRRAWDRGLPAVIVGDRDALQASDPDARYVSCPAESREVTCAECGLCAKPARMASPQDAPVITFAPHGRAARRVREVVSALNAQEA